MKWCIAILTLLYVTNGHGQITIDQLQGSWKQHHFSYLPCFDGKDQKDYTWYDSVGDVGILELEIVHDTAFLTTPTLTRLPLKAGLEEQGGWTSLVLEFPKKLFRKQKVYVFQITLLSPEQLLVEDLRFVNCREQRYFAEQTKYTMVK